MCGITGWVDFERDLREERGIAQDMTDTMACRGPDDEGLWTARHAAIGHRRLAIIDLAGGRQPMVAEEEGREPAVLTYSGEVYNFEELRAELSGLGHRFRTRSDTEVVLRAYLEWGEELAGHLNGMYAFAVWDARSERLLLVRDRMGIKPLYYYPTLTACCSAPSPRRSWPTRSPAACSTPTGCANCWRSSRRRSTASSPACTRCAPARPSP
ncbi:asparagine synthetase B family protein [Nonomuraea thailandensis]